MARRSKTNDSVTRQHLALSVASHLALTQLVKDPLASKNAQHKLEKLDLVGSALARSAPLYVLEVKTDEPRQLTPEELDGARAKSGASTLVLKDGRILSGVSIKRADLRQAIALLKAVGLAELGGASADREDPNLPKSAAAQGMEGLRAEVARIEALLSFPLLPAQVERANVLAIALARRAPAGRISNLAMRLLSAVHDARRGEGGEENIRVMLARLRAAVDELSVSET